MTGGCDMASRVILFDKDCMPLGDLPPSDISSLVRTEQINGEHKLVIETSKVLQIGWRVLMRDKMGMWHEYVVSEADEEHSSGKQRTGTYNLVWSLQWDLTNWVKDGDLGHAEPGMSQACTGAAAVSAALGGCPLWQAGNSDTSVVAGSGVVLIADNAWNNLASVANKWKGEVSVDIEVGMMGVTSRRVNLMAIPVDENGAQITPDAPPTRRFEWGRDLTRIERMPDPGPYYCRIVPIGKSTKEYAEGPGSASEDSVEFDWPMSLLSQPEYWPPKDSHGDVIPQDFWDGHEYLTDPVTENVFRYRDGESGDWVYPTCYVKYDKTDNDENVDISDDVELMYAEAAKDIRKGKYTQPKVTYEADVEQFALAGMDVTGVTLGDWVQCVDYGFNPDEPLAIELRITEIEVDELSGKMKLTVGEAKDTLVETIAKVKTETSDYKTTMRYMSTAKYVDDMLERISAEISGTSGFSYLVQGEGVITYDRKVSDPLVGTEATAVVQIKGGSIRIANEKNPSFSGINDWKWKTVFTAGHIAAEVVTAANITTGFIKDANENLVIDLDNGTMTFKRGVITSADGNSYWNLTTNVFHTTNAYLSGTIYATSGEIGGFTIETTNSSARIYNDGLSLSNRGLGLTSKGTADDRGIMVVDTVYAIGYIGTGKLNSDPGYRSLSFQLEYRGSYMAWSAKRTSSDTAYKIKFAYYNRTIIDSDVSSYQYLADTLYTGCNAVFRYDARFENPTYYYRVINYSPTLIGTLSQDNTIGTSEYGLTMYPNANGNFVGFGNRAGTPRVFYVAATGDYNADTFYVRCKADFGSSVEFGSSANFKGGVDFQGSVSVTQTISGGGTATSSGLTTTRTLGNYSCTFIKGILIKVNAV